MTNDGITNAETKNISWAFTFPAPPAWHWHPGPTLYKCAGEYSYTNCLRGPVLSSGQGFDTQQEALTLVQAAEQYRTAHPFGGNYGLGSYTICFKDGTQQRFQSPVFKGFNNPNSSEARNATHSEQSAYGWLQLQLSRLAIDQSTISATYAVIFSQVQVCPDCEQDMRFWQSTLRQKAKTQQVFLSIWDIVGGKGFNPATYPAGTGIAVTVDVLRKVPIQFVP